MSPLLARWLHAAALFVGGTGLVYGWMRYLAVPADEFAVVNHPRQPLLQELHLLSAPVLLFLCAMIWRSHVWPRVVRGHRERRWTGVLLTFTFFPMVASGYLIQTAEDWRLGWIWVHGISSSAWTLAYAVHVVRRTSAAG